MKSLLIAFSAVLLLSCERMTVNVPKKEYLRSFVMGYYDVKGVELKAYPNGTVGYPDNKVISISLKKGENIASYKDVDDSKKAVYDALCEKHRDMTYDRIVSLPVDGKIVEYSGLDIICIDITSDADFDTEHLKNTSLKDVIACELVSAKPFIDSGYIEYDEWRGSDMYRYSYINKNLVDIVSDDLLLLGWGMISYNVSYIGILIFDKEPTLSRTHTFTVTMTADDGRVFEASIEMTFE